MVSLSNRTWSSITDLNPRIFTAKNGWADKARTMCNDYYWGGRSEQTMVDEMRLSINPEIEKSDHNSAVNS